MGDVIQHQQSSGPMVHLSESARRHIVTYLKKGHSKGARLSLKKSGCSGLSYVIDYVEAPDVQDIVLPLEDEYVFCIDKSSYPYLKGVDIDYVKEGLNYKFIFNNPNQTGECGCGESFTVK